MLPRSCKLSSIQVSDWGARGVHWVLQNLSFCGTSFQALRMSEWLLPCILKCGMSKMSQQLYSWFFENWNFVLNLLHGKMMPSPGDGLQRGICFWGRTAPCLTPGFRTRKEVRKGLKDSRPVTKAKTSSYWIASNAPSSSRLFDSGSSFSNQSSGWLVMVTDTRTLSLTLVTSLHLAIRNKSCLDVHTGSLAF